MSAVFQDQKFQNALIAAASQVTGTPVAALDPGLTSLLTQLALGLFSGCLGNPTPTPTPAAIASQLKSPSMVQTMILKSRARKQAIQAGRQRSDGDIAAASLIAACQATSMDDLTQAVADAQTDAAAVPDLDMI